MEVCGFDLLDLGGWVQWFSRELRSLLPKLTRIVCVDFMVALAPILEDKLCLSHFMVVSSSRPEDGHPRQNNPYHRTCI